MTNVYYIHVIEYSMPVLPPPGQVVPEWAKTLNIQGNITSSAAVSDGVYICGNYISDDNILLGNSESGMPVSLPSDNLGQTHCFLIKYTHDGKVLWYNRFWIMSSYQKHVVAATSDAVYVYGIYYNGTNTTNVQITGANSTNVTIPLPVASQHMCLIRYKANGEVDWAKQVPGYANQDKWGIAASETNVYIIGDYSSTSNIVIDTNVELPAVARGVYILNYTAAGAIAWIKSLNFTNAPGAADTEQAYSVAVTGSTLYISGTYNTYNATPPPNIVIGRINSQDISLPQTSARWGYIIQYQLDGALVAYNTIKANRNVDLCTVAASGGNVYMCGRYAQENNTLVIGTTSSNTQVVLPISINSSGYLIKFEPVTLTPIWARAIPELYIEIYDIACTADSLYICGLYSAATDILLGQTAGGINVTLPINLSNIRGFLIKYDASSNPAWVKIIEGDYVLNTNYTVSLYANIIYFLGSFSSATPISIGNGITMTDTSGISPSFKFYIIKYSPLASPVTITPGAQTATVNWTKHPNAPSSATNKLYYYPTSQLSSLQDISLTSQTQALTGLQPLTSYTLYTSTTVDGLELLSPVYVFVTLANPICFLADAPVLTPTGYRPIHMLQVGDLVRTAAGRTVAVKRVFAKQYPPSASTNPFVIPKGLFGATRALPISPNHEVMVPGKGMVKAKDLGLQRMKMTGPFTYYNLELEDWVRDNLVVAGVVCESLAPAERIVMNKSEFMRFVKSRYGPEAAGRLRSVCFEEASGGINLPKLL